MRVTKKEKEKEKEKERCDVKKNLRQRLMVNLWIERFKLLKHTLRSGMMKDLMRKDATVFHSKKGAIMLDELCMQLRSTADHWVVSMMTPELNESYFTLREYSRPLSIDAFKLLNPTQVQIAYLMSIRDVYRQQQIRQLHQISRHSGLEEDTSVDSTDATTTASLSARLSGHNNDTDGASVIRFGNCNIFAAARVC